MTKINILYITCFGSMRGGGQRSLHLLIKHLDKTRFRPFLVVPEAGELKEAVERLGVTVFVLPLGRLRSLDVRGIVKGFCGLRRIIVETDADIISTDSVRETVYAGLLGRWQRVPVVLHLRVTDTHRLIDRMLYLLADRLIAVSHAAARRFAGMDKKKKVTVVYNGAELDTYRPLPPRSRDGMLRVGYFGRLEMRKGVDILIRAVKRLGGKPLCVHIFGEGEAAYEDHLKKLASGDDRIVFEGFVADTAGRMGQVDAVVLPSRFGEGLSRALIEAMALARPVIVSDIPSNPELLGPDLGGTFVFHNGDDADLARLFAGILEQPDLLVQAGATGRRRAEVFFDLEKNTRSIESVYRMTVASPPGLDIDARAYDADVEREGLEYQVGHYYEPTDAAMARRIDVVARHIDLRPGERVLDIGCGVGTFAFHAAKKGARGIGVDFSRKSLEAARILTARYGLEDRTSFVAAEASALPFRNGAFDKVVAADFVEHITDRQKVKLMREMVRVLSDDGAIVVFTPNKIREDVGRWYRMARHCLLGEKMPQNVLHFGLTDRRSFERVLKDMGLSFDFFYYDMTRPFLAHWPLVRHILSLNLLWVIRKRR